MILDIFNNTKDTTKLDPRDFYDTEVLTDGSICLCLKTNRGGSFAPDGWSLGDPLPDFSISFPEVTSLCGLFVNHIWDVIDITAFNTSNITDFSQMFYNCKHLTKLKHNFNFTNARDTSHMFQGCRTLETLELDLHGAKLKQTGSMFRDCFRLNTLLLKGFDYTTCENYIKMFYNCRNLTTLEPNLTSLHRTEMFENCKIFTKIS